MPNLSSLTRALEVFRAGGMTTSRMRECIQAWLNGADFTDCEDVFVEADRCLNNESETQWDDHPLPWYAADFMIWDARGDAIVNAHSETGRPYFEEEVEQRILAAVNIQP